MASQGIVMRPDPFLPIAGISDQKSDDNEATDNAENVGLYNEVLNAYDS